MPAYVSHPQGRHSLTSLVNRLLATLLVFACPTAILAQAPPEGASGEEPASITQELLHSLDAIDQELIAQQRRLAAVSTDEERRRLQNRLRELQTDRQTLEQLLRKLSGQDTELRDEARDRKRDQWTTQDESALELHP